MNWLRRLFGREPRSPYGRYAHLVLDLERRGRQFDIDKLHRLGGRVPPGYTGEIMPLIVEQMLKRAIPYNPEP
jgi:hypothetical protein